MVALDDDEALADIFAKLLAAGNIGFFTEHIMIDFVLFSYDTDDRTAVVG